MKHRRGDSRGFTLVEVLVALLPWPLLAGLAWQGLDSVLRTREASREPSTAPRGWPPSSRSGNRI
jgi:type II secretory pathway component PulJ